MHGKESLIGLVTALVIGITWVGPSTAQAQISDTTAFLAQLENEYRIVPDVVYHVADNYENTMDLYLPTNADGPTPVLMTLFWGGWVGGTREAQALRLLPYLEMGWAVANVSYRLVQVSRAPAAVEVHHGESRGGVVETARALTQPGAELWVPAARLASTTTAAACPANFQR